MMCTGGSSAVKGVILRCGCLNTLRLDKLRTNPQEKHGSLTTFSKWLVSRLPHAAFAHLASNCWNPLRAAWFSLVSGWRHAGPSMCAVAQQIGLVASKRGLTVLSSSMNCAIATTVLLPCLFHASRPLFIGRQQQAALFSEVNFGSWQNVRGLLGHMSFQWRSGTSCDWALAQRWSAAAATSALVLGLFLVYSGNRSPRTTCRSSKCRKTLVRTDEGAQSDQNLVPSQRPITRPEHGQRECPFRAQQGKKSLPVSTLVVAWRAGHVLVWSDVGVGCEEHQGQHRRSVRITSLPIHAFTEIPAIYLSMTPCNTRAEDHFPWLTAPREKLTFTLSRAVRSLLEYGCATNTLFISPIRCL